MSDITLQINLSPGDVAYAHLTVPALLAAHPTVAERLLVVDCCRPQKTRIVSPEERFPADSFRERVATVRSLAQQWLLEKRVDRVEFLEPGSAHFSHLARRYCRPWMRETHDYGGCAFMAYWAAFEFTQTRFLLHYDADMVLHQANAYDWSAYAQRHLERSDTLIAASPRTSPPGFDIGGTPDAPTRHEGRPFAAIPGGWANDWFSTRCFLFDRVKLEQTLPLVQGKEAWIAAIKRIAGRAYPPAPEIVLFRHLAPRGFRRLNLGSRDAWLLHPTRKPAEYLRLLPSILAEVKAGRVPDDQRGNSEIDVPAWTKHLAGITGEL